MRTPAINAIIKNYSVQLKELEAIQEDQHGETSFKAFGFLKLMENSAHFWTKTGIFSVCGNRATCYYITGQECKCSNMY